MKSIGELATDIFEYESGEMQTEDMFQFYVNLINSGVIVSLQGQYQRTANDLKDAGIIERNEHTKQWNVSIDHEQLK